jgi:GcrA cell cycle regulator
MTFQVLIPWSDDEIAIVRDGLNAKQSAAQIACKLKGRTRNAVIGMVRRRTELRKIGFGGKLVDPRLKKTAKEARRNAPKDIAAHHAPKAAKTIARPTVAICKPVEPIGPGITADENDFSCCQWPLGDPRTSEFRYCGGPKAVRLRHGKEVKAPYCEFHCAKAYEPARSRAA